MTYWWIALMVGMVLVPWLLDRDLARWERGQMSPQARRDLDRARWALEDAEKRAAGERASARIARRMGIRHP